MINQNWVFGIGAGLDFSTTPPTATSGFSMNTGEGCASISDNAGNLLLYTDGRTVWDGSHNVRATGLLGDPSSTQSAIIVPDPGNNGHYYIFTADGSSNSAPPFNHFNGISIDVNTWATAPLPAAQLPSNAGLSPTERVLAVQHENCQDYWIITVVQKGRAGATMGEGIFRVWSLDSSGFNFVGATSMNRDISDLGYLKAAHDGTRIALADYLSNTILVYPFDNTNGNIDVPGELSLAVPTLPNGRQQRAYGIEFSPNSQLLYYGNLVTGANNGNIYQVNLTAPTPTSTFIGGMPNGNGRYAIGALQLGMDGVIYIAKDNESRLAAILNPDVVGTGCNLNQNYITLLPGTRVILGLPNLLPLACLGDTPCGCKSCTDNTEELNAELIDRAKEKHNLQSSGANCPPPFEGGCEAQAVVAGVNFEPCFHFHWGDGAKDQIEEHDTEVFYLTVCNNFSDVRYNGLQISKVTLVPDVHPLDKIHIVPDRLISFDCLEPCSCQTREFAIITRANDTAGNYRLEVEYCFEDMSIVNSSQSGTVGFDVEITKD